MMMCVGSGGRPSLFTAMGQTYVGVGGWESRGGILTIVSRDRYVTYLYRYVTYWSRVKGDG